MQFSDRLKQARRSLIPAVTQAAAAKVVGVHPITWSRWERGELTPDVDMLKKIAKTLKTKPSKLVD